MDKQTKTLLGFGAIALSVIGYFIYKNKDKKCVLKKGLKWGSEYDIDIDDIIYYQNFQDLRSGIFYTRVVETKNPYKYDGGINWYRRYDNKDMANASWCGDFLEDGTLDPNCLINRRELEDLYLSGAVC